MAGAAHLVRRFFGSLSPRPPSAVDEEWVVATLAPGELELWQRMSRADRRHAAGVGRRVQRALGSEATRPVLAAALLHDVGKVAAGLGTYGRVVATLSEAAGGRAAADDWSRRSGFTRRVGLYLRHSELGGDLLDMAGSDPLTSAWAREHHHPAEQWSVPASLGAVLKAADDD
jgi:hypothetical protein